MRSLQEIVQVNDNAAKKELLSRLQIETQSLASIAMRKIRTSQSHAKIHVTLPCFDCLPTPGLSIKKTGESISVSVCDTCGLAARFEVTL